MAEGVVMSKVRVHRANDLDAVAANPALATVGEALCAIRRRAFELYETRGGAPGGDLEDWLQAERDLFFVPHAEVNETEEAFHMMVSAAGFQAGDVEVIALPRELLVEGKTERRLEPKRDCMRAGGLELKTLYRRFDFGTAIETEGVTARIDEGSLTIEAPKKRLHRLKVQATAA